MSEPEQPAAPSGIDPPPPGRRGAAFFDLDKTVIARSSALAFGRPLYRAGMLNRRGLLKAAVGQIVYLLFGADERRMEKLRSALLTLAKGWDKARVEALVREAVDEVVAPIVYAEALVLIDEHQRAGRRVYIVSSAPEEVVRPLASYLGVEDVVATRSRVDERGRYTGELEFYAYGPWKAEALRWLAEVEGISLEDSYAYSDGITDLPFLEGVGHPVAVNPDKALARYAAERGWPVLRFQRPITIRTRLAELPRPVPLLSGAAVLLAAGALVVVVLLRARRRPPPSLPERLAARLLS